MNFTLDRSKGNTLFNPPVRKSRNTQKTSEGNGRKVVFVIGKVFERVTYPRSVTCLELTRRQDVFRTVLVPVETHLVTSLMTDYERHDFQTGLMIPPRLAPVFLTVSSRMKWTRFPTDL